MDFAFGDEHRQLRETVRRHAEAEIRPLAREADDTERFPKPLFRRWGELGLIGARYPEADGGVGMDKISDCIIREEIGRVSQAFGAAFSAHGHLGIWPIWRAGTAAQKAAFFRPALAGENVACFALSEPDGGSNIRALKTRAEKVAGGYRINGSKLYITNAPMADFMMLATRTAPELTADAISLFIVPLPDPAVAISHLAKEGLKGSETGLVHINDLFVPDAHVLGERLATYPVILDSLTENRVGVAAATLGVAKGLTRRPWPSHAPASSPASRSWRTRPSPTAWPTWPPTSKRRIGWSITAPGGSTEEPSTMATRRRSSCSPPRQRSG